MCYGSEYVGPWFYMFYMSVKRLSYFEEITCWRYFKRIFGLKRNALPEERGKLHNSCSSCGIIVIKLKEWDGWNI